MSSKSVKIIRSAWQDGRDDARAKLAGTDYYGAHAVRANSFAAACYDQNMLGDLDLSRATRADRWDRETWHLSSSEWAYQIGVAYEAKLWDWESYEPRRLPLNAGTGS